MNTSMNILPCLQLVYVGLTTLKITQWLIMACRRVFSNDIKNRMEFTPSLQVSMWIVDNVWVRQDQEVSKLPRRVFREVTDPWVAEYHAKVVARIKIRPKPNTPKIYKNAHHAMADFFCDFCQDPSGGFFIHWAMNGIGAFIRQPLGLNSLLALLYHLGLAPLFLLREKIVCRGTVISFACKMAAAVTIPEVYVVSCKEQLSFEAALQKYPWVAGVYNKPQIHAMMGKAVCPLYKREFPFPQDNVVMDFEYEVLDAGMALIRQKHNTVMANLLYEDLYVSHVALLCLGLLLIVLDEWQSIYTIVPYAAAFYVIRELVDWNMGIHWHSKFHYYR